MAFTTENPNEENIKCVIVGDNNVGKTRLVCARAYSQYGPNSQYSRYGGTHIPTVWANDHYRNDVDVLNKARGVIDGVDVSLRLWDTFGDHNKNRKFSYGRADVIIICFSVCDPKSLKHIKSFWLPDIRHHCKGVPVILVGCKIDLRFANIDELNKRKNTLARRIRSGDIVYPEICRQIAADAGCPYYETSVLEGFGIKDVFDNAIRAALIYKRKMYLYRNVQFRHVQKPILQEPLTPPKPDPPKPPEKSTEALLNFSTLFDNPNYSDLLIVGKDFQFHAHKVILATASNLFHRFFMSHEPKTMNKMVVYGEEQQRCKEMHTDDVYIMSLGLDGMEETRSLEVDNNSGDQVVPELVSETLPKITVSTRPVPGNYGLESVESKSSFNFVSKFKKNHEENLDCGCDVLELSPDISHFAFMNIMYFYYKGRLNPEIIKPNWLKENIQQFSELFMTSQRFGNCHLANILTEVLNETDETIIDVYLKKFDVFRKNAIKEHILCKDLYSDVKFEADDGTLPGHKAILVCGSELMSVMFGSDFIESGNKVIPLPDTSLSSLKTLFVYIYTKKLLYLGGNIVYTDIIALANRFCLPDFISVLEIEIIKELQRKTFDNDKKQDIHENVVLTLEIVQLHNAHNLAEWCIHYITTNYNDVCRKCKFIKTLTRDNQARLEQQRWPPVWFIKDYDSYERACRKKTLQDKEEQKRRSNKRI